MAVSSFSGSVGDTSGGISNFFLNVGPSGNTTYVMPQELTAGKYTLSSNEGDTTFDIYLVSRTDELSGYTTTTDVIALTDFNKIVVYGATPNDIINFTFESIAITPSTSGDVDGGAAPYADNITPIDLESFDDTATLTGGNFADDVEVVFIGTNDVELDAKNVVKISSSELVVTRPDTLIPDHAPYDVKVTNPGVPVPTTQPNAHILTDAITAGTYPVWVSGPSLFWEKKDGMTSLSLVAEDTEQSDIDYEIVSGSLFPGFSLNQETGAITGDDSALEAGDFVSFTVRATDTAGNTADKSFDLYIDLYPIHSWYFEPFLTESQTPLGVFLHDYSIKSLQAQR